MYRKESTLPSLCSSQVITPSLLSATTDVQHTQVVTVSSSETALSKTTRQAKKWATLVNGGFATHHEKAFQDR